MVFGRRNISEPGTEGNRRGRNWMTAMGILFIVMAVIIALRNLYFYSTQLSVWFYLDNYTNAQINNEKFVIAMLVGGGFLLGWGYFRKSQDDPPADSSSKYGT
ncbi:MAG TPA: hypothetical protein VJ729_17510 [Nitrososphaeraceae archaeon]|nr:hypothetical protein [Nitrososphaeraceae archaeon]